MGRPMASGGWWAFVAAVVTCATFFPAAESSAHDRYSRGGRDREVDVAEDGGGSARYGDVGGDELRAMARW